MTMIKAEAIEKMMNSENGGLFAAIIGIVAVFGIDSVVKHSYKVDANKESITLAPAWTADEPETEQGQ